MPTTPPTLPGLEPPPEIHAQLAADAARIANIHATAIELLREHERHREQATQAERAGDTLNMWRHRALGRLCVLNAVEHILYAPGDPDVSLARRILARRTS